VGQIAPSQAVAQDEQDAPQGGAVTYPRRSAVAAGWFEREERLDRRPQIVADGVRVGHRRGITGSALDRKNSPTLSVVPLGQHDEVLVGHLLVIISDTTS
jgi:hypothetical protein